MSEEAFAVIAVDPGRSKCGVAVVRRDPLGRECPTEVLHQSVVATKDLESTITELASRFAPDAVIVGGGTTSRGAAEKLERSQPAPVVVVEEAFTTLEARKRYFQAHPPRGLRKLLPLSLQFPPRPYDDFVAVILAERYLLGARE